MTKIILQKYIADTGLCSRRQAEALIREERVLINNQIAELGMRADDSDVIVIDDQPLKSQSATKVYFKLNKPVGYTCTNRSFPGEDNIFDLVDYPERLFAVGRLDKDSRGLVFLTNDGDLAQKLAHPKYKQEKRYLVRVYGRFELTENTLQPIIKAFRTGVYLGEDGIATAEKVRYLNDNEFEVILTQGKKRQLRRMFEKFGLGVSDLKRVQIGPIKLGDLQEGFWEELDEHEIKQLKRV